jgi:hypothetical protein
MLLARRHVLFLRLGNDVAQRHHQPRPRHLQHVEGGLARWRLEIRAGRPTELQDLQVGIDQHGRRRELTDRHAVGFTLGRELPAQGIGRAALIGERLKPSPTQAGDVGGLPSVLGGGQSKRRGRRRLLREILCFLSNGSKSSVKPPIDSDAPK